LADLNHEFEISDLIAESTVTHSERRWLFAMAATLGVMLAVIVLTGITQMLHPLSSVETIDASQIHLEGEFTEPNLGVHANSDGSLVVRMLAEQYMFVPQCVQVPAGKLIHFRLTSADVTHGFFVGATNTNAMVVPGFITDVKARFQATGNLTMPCDEFCGFRHHAMAAKVVVMPHEKFDSLADWERQSCGSK
jgi:cytochrome c oxidase subunit 2